MDNIYSSLKYLARIGSCSDIEVREDIPELSQECQFSEKFLQAIWNERHLSHDLKTVDGMSLRIISPGIWNVSGGPDFKDAALLFDGVVKTGDVEIHRYASDWYSHGHDTDSAYNNVVLHVVWADDAPDNPSVGKTLVMSKYLQSGWRSLLWELEDACYPYSRQVPAGDCSLRWAMTADSRARDLLQAAGIARFSAKANVLARLSAELGQNQALYESIFEALGYKSNRLAFRRLSRHASLDKLRMLPDAKSRSAYLFGLAGLIPDPTRENVLPVWRSEVEELWDKWWGCGLGESFDPGWNRRGCRPYNSPCRRLAAGIHILETMNYEPASWLKTAAFQCHGASELVKRIESLSDKDSLWNGYTDFGHKISPSAILLGRDRLMDMLSNVFLPFLAGIFQADDENQEVVTLALNAFTSLPKGQENRLFKEAVQRFLNPPSRVRDLVKSACHQQGLLDIYKNFCQVLDNNCNLCPFARGGTPEKEQE